MKKILALALAAAMMTAISSCGTTGDTSKTPSGSGSGNVQPPEGKTYEIVALGKSVATDNWQMFFAGCRSAAADLNGAVNLTVDGASNATAYEEQLNMIENYLSSGCDAISVAPCSSDSVIPTLTNAHQNGTVVGISDTAVAFDEYDNFCAFDNYMAGEYAAQAMFDKMKADNADYAGKKIIQICPVPGVQTLDDRMAGFTTKMKELAPEIEMVDPMYCDGDNAVALSNAQDAWQAYGSDIIGMFGLDEGVCDAISRCMDENSLNGKFYIVGIDATSLSIADVESGNVCAVIGMSMYDMGYTAIQNMYKVLQGESVEKDTILPPVIITAENMNEDGIREIWDASMFKQ